MWADLPLVLGVDDVAGLIGANNVYAVRRAVQRGDLPEPAMVRPMRWSRADLERHLRFTTGPVQASRGR